METVNMTQQDISLQRQQLLRLCCPVSQCEAWFILSHIFSLFVLFFFVKGKRRKEKMGKQGWVSADRECKERSAAQVLLLGSKGNEVAPGAREEEVTWRWVRCGARWEVTNPVKLSRGWVGLKPHCKPFFPLRQAKLEGWDGTGLQVKTWGHFITESVRPEDGKRIILQTGFIAGDNSLAEPTVGKRHIGWGYNIASFTAPNRLIFSYAHVEMCVLVNLLRGKFEYLWGTHASVGSVWWGLWNPQLRIILKSRYGRPCCSYLQLLESIREEERYCFADLINDISKTQWKCNIHLVDTQDVQMQMNTMHLPRSWVICKFCIRL